MKEGWKANFPFYTEQQMGALINLARDIINRKNIKPWNIVGHSDVAPQRKYDPGLRFPWKLLAKEGIGLWHEDKLTYSPGEVSKDEFVAKLRSYGYCVADVNSPESLKKVVAAFQARFRPTQVDGIIDAQTDAILGSLLSKKRTY